MAEHLRQLDTARRLVLGDAALYPQIVQGILPIIGANGRLEIRRWGADFLAETFASPTLAQQQKQDLCILILGTLDAMLDGDDTDVLKSVIQTAASIYPLVFKHMYVNPLLFVDIAIGNGRAYDTCIDMCSEAVVAAALALLWGTTVSYVVPSVSLELPNRPTALRGTPCPPSSPRS